VHLPQGLRQQAHETCFLHQPVQAGPLKKASRHKSKAHAARIGREMEQRQALKPAETCFGLVLRHVDAERLDEPAILHA